MSKRQWGFLFFALSAMPIATASGPIAPQIRLELSHAMATMPLLQIGNTVSSTKSKSGEQVRVLELELYGLPLLNLKLKAVDELGGKSIALDQYRLPLAIPSPMPQISEKEIVFHVRKIYPSIYVKHPILGYIGEREPGRFNRLNQIIKRMRLVWSFGLSNLPNDSMLGASRFLVMDAHSGEIIQDEPAFQSERPTPEPFVGFGYHSGMVLLDGSRSTSDLNAFCMRNPFLDYPADGFFPIPPVTQPACAGLVGANLIFGISAGRYQMSGTTETFTPFTGLTQQPTMGDGTVMNDMSDTAGEESLAVDMYYYAGKSIEFYRNNFGRTHIGSIAGEDRLTLIPYMPFPNSFQNTAVYDNAFAVPSKSLIFVNPTSDVVNLSSNTTAQTVMHEYTHLVMRDEFRPVTSDPEYRAINEGIADIFGVLFKTALYKDPQTLKIVESTEWLFGDTEAPSDRPYWRYFDLPSRDGNSADHYPYKEYEFAAFDALDPHHKSGVIRRWFYALANGLDPYTPPFNGASSSRFLLEGMEGIGVRQAAEVLYEAITTNSTPGSGPDFLSFRYMTLPTACDETYQSIEDAWKAVGIGLGSDRNAPTIKGTLVLNSPTEYQIRLKVSDQSDLAIPRQFSVSDQGGEIGTGALILDNAIGSSKQYVGSAVFPINAFSSTGPASAKIDVKDLCGNIGSLLLTETKLQVTKTGTPRSPKLSVSISPSTPIRSVEFSDEIGTVHLMLAGPSGTFSFEHTFTTSNWPDGAQNISIEGADVFGNTYYASQVLVADNTPPQVVLRAIDGGAPPYQLIATALDKHPIVNARFFIGNETTPFATDYTAPFEALYIPVDNNATMLKVEVADSYGNVGIARIEAPRDVLPPTITLNVQHNALADTLSVTASDPCGFSSATMKVDGIVIASPLIPGPASSTFNWSGFINHAVMSVGAHVFNARITDRCGNTSEKSQTFTVFATQPGAVVEVILDPLHPKRATIRARVLNDRYIRKIELRRGTGQNSVLLQTWTTTNTINPIHDFSLSTADASWATGWRDIEVWAYNDLPLGIGIGSRQIYVDNTAPTLNATFPAPAPTAWFTRVTASDVGPIPFDNMKTMNSFVVLFNPGITKTAAPWTIDLVTVIPIAYSGADALMVASATDKFGNKRTRSWMTSAQCTIVMSNRICTFTPPSLIAEELIEHADP